MDGKPSRLAIVAGGGALPDMLIAACRDRSLDAFVVAIEGQADPDWCSAAAHATLRLGEFDKLVRLLREAKADALVFAGKIRRPPLRSIRLDWRSARVLAGLVLRGTLGDDAVASAIVRSFEREGFRIVAPHELLGETVAIGPLGHVSPSPEQERDIARGVRAAREIGRLDIGHAVVVQDGAVIAVEGAEGTDALIRRCATLPRGGARGILVKMAKPQQDRRVDPPTIGCDTVAHAGTVGFSGIAFEADRTLVVDLPAMIRAADAAGLFLVGLEPGA